MMSGALGQSAYSNHRSSNEGLSLPVAAISKKELLQQNKLRSRIHQLREKKQHLEEEVEKQGLVTTAI